MAVLAGSFVASKNAIAASGATVVAAAVVTNDWVTWFISGVGAVAYRLRKPEINKVVSISNGIISVCLGGLGAPWIVSVVIPGAQQPPDYLSAFLVALLWPYMFDKYIQSKDKL